MGVESELEEFRVVLRPDKGGTNGRKITVNSNIFPLKTKAFTLYQYDVSISPDINVENSKKLWAKVEEYIGKEYGREALIVYDGNKIAFSSIDIPEEIKLQAEIDIDSLDVKPAPITGNPRTTTFKTQNKSPAFRSRMGTPVVSMNVVTSSAVDNVANSSDNGDHTLINSESESAKNGMKKFSVVIKKTLSIDMEALKKCLKGDDVEEEEYNHSITALGSFLRHFARYSFVSIGPNLYSPTSAVSLSGGLDLWRGYHQSLKVMRAGHLGVNIDLAATVFRRGNASLLSLITETLNVSSPEKLLSVKNLKDRISEGFKGANVITKYASGSKIRFKIHAISDLDADQFYFEGPNGRVSVAQYYKSRYKIQLVYPKLPLALKQNSSAFPLELLHMQPSQRFLKRLSPNQVTEVLRNTALPPNKRKAIIDSAASKDLGNNKYLQSSGCTMDKTSMKVNARVIESPLVVLSQGQRVSGRQGFWRMNTKAVDPMKIKSYAFVSFCRVDNRDISKLISMLLTSCRDLGMDFPNKECPKVIRCPRSERDVENSLCEAMNEADQIFKSRCELIFCLIRKGEKFSRSNFSLYEKIKRTTLTDLDVLSQCMLLEKACGRVNMQYTNNIALKLNVKLGGANNFVDHLPMFNEHTQIFGADVTHAQPGSISPSVAAVVASLNSTATRYFTSLRAQNSRQEIIKDLKSVMLTSLNQYKKHNGVYPERIIFFRDGVSSGQFKQVLNEELKSIKEAIYECKECTAKVTLLVVQKRHHVRFFPLDENKDKSGNCLPGTVVDDDITHPSQFNFYLQSHAGIQGTSRPVLYHVLHDENAFNSDSMQQLCYNLCFLSERANRSVSQVSPSYRAHIAAFLGRTFLEADLSQSSELKDSSKVSIRKVMPLVDENRMYYM